MHTFILNSGFDSEAVDGTPDCIIWALCAASSRMAAVALFRQHGVMGVSGKNVARIDWREGLPEVAAGEVWVKPKYVDREWQRR